MTIRGYHRSIRKKSCPYCSGCNETPGLAGYDQSLHSTHLSDRTTNMERKSFSDEIRDAVRRCGRSNYDLADDMNVARSILSRFVHGQGGISTEKLDKLAEVLDLHVVVGQSEMAIDDGTGTHRLTAVELDPEARYDDYQISTSVRRTQSESEPPFL